MDLILLAVTFTLQLYINVTPKTFGRAGLACGEYEISGLAIAIAVVVM